MWATRWPATAILVTALLFSYAAANDDDKADTLASAKDDVERTPLHTVMPVYPKIARRDRIEGEVQVCFEITRKGNTRRIAVRKSTHRLFERPSIRAVRASTYVPLPKDATVYGIKSCRTFRFTLEPVVVETGN